MSRNSLGTCTFLGLLLVAFSLPAATQNTPHRLITSAWQKWLDDDVVWIMTNQERIAFKNLTTDEQRDAFVEAFWESRNPDPGARENKLKEEHYRRIAYANTQFPTAIPGWQTDRGRIYIIHGAPDSIDYKSYASGVNRLISESEVWHYHYIRGLGQGVSFRFVDECKCGNYELLDSHADKPAGTPY
jgi:GWxTD domain-containing protein